MATSKPVKRIKLDSKKKPITKKVEKKESKATKVTAASTEAPVKKQKITAKKAARVAASPATGFAKYVGGSWNELRQVRWPNRSATWGLTLAVIAFTLFFTIVILILDAGFQYLFKEVLLK